LHFIHPVIHRHLTTPYGNISFIFDHPIICKTVKFIDQWDNSSQSVLGFNTSRFGSLFVDWWV